MRNRYDLMNTAASTIRHPEQNYNYLNDVAGL